MNKNEQEKLLPQEKWVPNQYLYTEQPLFRFVPNFYFKLRNKLFYFFQYQMQYGSSFGYYLFLLLAWIGTIILTYFGYTKDYFVLQGKITSVFLGITFLLSTKNSILVFLTGMRYETQVRIHKIVAFFTLVMAYLHGGRALIEMKFKISGQQEISGTVMISAVLLLVVTGILSKYIKINHNKFIVIHKILFIIAYVAAFIHSAYYVFYFGVFWVWLDLLIRFTNAIINRYRFEKVEFDFIGNQYLKLTFKKNTNMKFQEGQFYFLVSPQLSWINYHPFTIASSNADPNLEFIIKKEENWTKDLFEKIKGDQNVSLYLDGPYGGPTINTDQDVETFLLISGGIGVTPMIANCKKLLNDIKNGRKTQKIFFYWVGRDFALSQEIEKLKLIDKKLDLNVLEVEYYCTSKDPVDAKLNYQQGRPDLKGIFEKVSKHAQKQQQKQIISMVCGPKQLNDHIIKLSSDFSKDGINFYVNFEEFNLLYIQFQFLQ